MDFRAKLTNIKNRMTSAHGLFIVSLLIIGGVFVIDAITPYGAIHWILYLIPLILIYRTGNGFYVAFILFMIFLMSFLGAIITGNIPNALDLPLLDVVNRVEGLFVFVLFSVIIDKLYKSRKHFRDTATKLSQSEDSNRALIQGLPDIIRRLDLQGRHIFVSKNIEGVFGLKPDQFIGKTNRDLGFPEERCLMWEEGIKRVIESGKPYEREYSVVSEFGVRYFNWRLVPEFDENNTPRGVISINRDITERRQNAEALDAERERLAVTLLSIGDGVITTDNQGNVDIMNPVAEELCGWQQNEAHGKPITSIFAIVNEITGEPLRSPFDEVLHAGKSVELANRTLLVSKNGVERIIADSAAPIRDRNNGIIGVVIVFRDITERQKFTEAMQRNQNLESLGMLAGGIAHDFNNLTAGIFGYIELAKREDSHDYRNQYLSKAMATIDRARSLTQQLLTFAKGGFPVRKFDNLFPLVSESAKFALSGSNVSCTFDVPDNLWPSNFDKGQISQVIDNIVINAVQAMPNGGTVDISATNVSLGKNEHVSLPKGEYVKISITDHGIGIPKEIRSRIFDPFFSTKTMGHGIGLATCYSIIYRHGGGIDVDSEPGKGSSFHVFLPAFMGSLSFATEEAQAEHRGTGMFLVMDDVAIMRETTGLMLRTFGYAVMTAANGKEAIDIFLSETKANRKITGLIFDLTIQGGMGGKEAIKEIRKHDADIPAFVASGYTEDPVMANAKEFGFTASISKPFKISELAKLLNRYIPEST